MDSPRPQRYFLSTDFYRYVVAGGFALLFTLSILLLMTRLIMSLDDDPAVTNTQQKLELHRVIIPQEENVMRLFERLDNLRFSEIPEIEVGEAREPRPIVDAQQVDKSEPDPDQPDRSTEVDLRETALAIIREMEGDKYQAWLEAQSGKRKYVSIMQGPMPTDGNSRASSEPGETVGSDYRSAYGESEVIISDNCLMQIRSTTFDYSDFAAKLPATVRCKRPDPKIDLSGLENNVAPPKRPAEDESAE